MVSSNDSNIFDEIGGGDVSKSIKNITSDSTIAIGISSDPSSMFIAFGFNAIFGAVFLVLFGVLINAIFG